MPRDRPPGIWESLKRALGGGDARPETPPVRPAPQPPSVSPAEEPFAAPPFLLADESPPEPSRAFAPPPPVDLPLPDAEPPPTGAAASETADAAEAADRPRLARGLASFSRSNADREKKFAHLLRDDSPGRKNR